MKHYFTKKESLYSPFFDEVMDKNRFFLFSKFFHFNNNQQFDPNGNILKLLLKLWPILTHMKAKFFAFTSQKETCSSDITFLPVINGAFKHDRTWSRNKRASMSCALILTVTIPTQRLQKLQQIQYIGTSLNTCTQNFALANQTCPSGTIPQKFAVAKIIEAEKNAKRAIKYAL